MQLARAFQWFVDFLVSPVDTARLIAQASDDTFLSLLAPRQHTDGTVTLLPYRHPLVRAAIIEAKFHRNRRAFALLAAALTEYLLAHSGEMWDPTTFTLVPVPLGVKRRQERGYNQTEEVARQSGFPVSLLLTRTRETAPQTSLTRKDRLKNMAGAFTVAEPPIPGHLYIVLDDVLTTGATLDAAASTLQAAGAVVERLALAH